MRVYLASMSVVLSAIARWSQLTLPLTMIRPKSLIASSVMVLGLGGSKSLVTLKTDSGVDPRVKKCSFKEGNRPKQKY